MKSIKITNSVSGEVLLEQLIADGDFTMPVLFNEQDHERTLPMEQIDYSAQARMNHIAETITAGKYELLPTCTAQVDDMRGVSVTSAGGYRVGISTAFINDHSLPAIIEYFKDQLDHWEAYELLVTTRPPTLIHQ